MLTLMRADRLEFLADAMLDSFVDRAGAVDREIDLTPEIIVVPSLGVARWLQERVARRFGIAANLEFAFPAQLLWRLAARLVPGIASESPFDPASVAWRVYRLLGEASRIEALAPLARYLERTGGDPLSRMQLADRVAEIFDRLTTYRADDWLAAWSAGRSVGLPERETEAWQAALWRVLLDDLALTDRRHPLARFTIELAEVARARAALPARIRLFAPSVLPPLYRRGFVALARAIDVEWYALEPGPEYLGDLESPARIAKLAAGGDARAAHAHQAGHALLASWGRQAIDQNEMLTDLGNPEASGLEANDLQSLRTIESFDAPRGDGVLQRLQRAIHALDESTLLALDRDDASLVIHACAGLQRQFEALHDDLLARFDADPSLEPHQVAVFVPDIDAAQSAIETVFGQAPQRIPYRVTGARAAGEPLLAAWTALLDLAGSRYAVEPVLALLRTPACARRFGLDDAAVESLAQWIAQSGARWGLDATHRAALGGPADARSTWAWAIERLVLGAALAPRGEREFAAPVLGVLPLPALEGDATAAIAGLLRFLRVVERIERDARRDRSPEAWAAWFLESFDRCFVPSLDETPQVQRLRAAAATFAENARRGDCALAIPFALARDRWSRASMSSAPGAVPTGAVTFAAIGALRGVPFRVIAMLGMDDGAFPRPRVPMEFDLMAVHPRRGDRDLRHEDRGAMLDALLAARDALIFGATVRDVRDNAARPACVLLEELVDAIASQARVARDAAWGVLAREHPLHGFAPAAFDPAGRVVPHVAAWAAAAREIARPAFDRIPAPVALHPLPIDESVPRRLGIGQLVGLLAHPARHFLRTRLRAECAPETERRDEDEPFVLERRARWALSERLQSAIDARCDTATLEAVAQASAELPGGPAGEFALAQLRAQLAAAARLAARTAGWGEAQAPRPIVFEHAGWVLEDTLGDLLGQGGQAHGQRVRSAMEFRASGKASSGNVRARIDAYVRHLAAQIAAGPIPTFVCGLDRAFSLAPLADAHARLAALIDVYALAQRSPLLCPPKTAWLIAAGADPRDAQRVQWRGARGDGESTDPWWRALLGGPWERMPSIGDFPGATSAFGDASFLDLVQRVIAPMQGAIDETGSIDAPLEA